MKRSLKATCRNNDYYENLLLRIARGISDAHKLAGRFEQGIRDLYRVIKLLDEHRSKNQRLHAEILLHISYLYYDGLSDFSKGAKTVEAALDLINRKNNPALYAQGLTTQGMIARSRSDYTNSIVSLQKALRIYTGINDVRGIMNAHHCLGSVSWSIGNLDKAIDHYKKNLALAKKLKDRSAIAAGHGNLGLVHWQKGNLKTALSYYEKEIELCEEIGFKKGLAITHGNAGLVYRHMRKFKKAQQCFTTQMELNESIGHRTGVAIACSNIASILYVKGQYDEALAYLKRYLAISKSIDYTKGIGIASNNIGAIYLMKKNYKTALPYFQTYLALSEASGFKRGIGVGNLYTGKVYRYMHDCAYAERHLLQAKKVLEELGDKINLSEAYAELAQLKVIQKRKQEALSLANKALELARATSSKEKEQFAREALARARQSK